jgi:hypothetical protein
VQERAAADVGQLPAIVQFPQHRHRVCGLTPIGQAQDGSPDGSVGGPVEVGFLDQRGNLGQEVPGSQNSAKDGLFGLQVVRWLAVGVGYRSQAAPCHSGSRFSAGHRRGVRGPLPRRRACLVARGCWSRTCLT